MEEKFNLKVVTPEKVYNISDIDSIEVSTDNGIVTILSHHAEYLANVEISLAYIVKGNEKYVYSIGGGAIHFNEKENLATLVVTSIHSPDDVDVKALKEKEKIQIEKLSKTQSIQEQKRAELILKRITNDLKLINK